MSVYTDIDPGKDGRKQLADRITEVTDVAQLEPWEKHRDDGETIVYTHNNTESDDRPPLILQVTEDTVIKLTTTAHGEPTITPGQHKLARKGFRRDESAVEWLQERFTV